ncbi:MAG: twin-arginine translocase TatA/TatE family subunit [Acidobacteriota bacterium]
MWAVAIPHLFGTIGLPEVMIVLLLVVVIFGARKLPDLGKGLGEGIRNFRKGLRSDGKDPSLKDPEDKESDNS